MEVELAVALCTICHCLTAITQWILRTVAVQLILFHAELVCLHFRPLVSISLASDHYMTSIQN